MEHNCGITNMENFGALLKSIIGNLKSIIGPGLSELVYSGTMSLSLLSDFCVLSHLKTLALHATCLESSYT